MEPGAGSTWLVEEKQELDYIKPKASLWEILSVIRCVKF